MTAQQIHVVACPTCVESDLFCESALDDEGQPTGELLITCATCGRVLGTLPSRAPAAEAEPEVELAEESATLVEA